jgi:hypothetical protein
VRQQHSSRSSQCSRPLLVGLLLLLLLLLR